MFVLVGHIEAVNRKRVKEAAIEYPNFPSLCCGKWVMTAAFCYTARLMWQQGNEHLEFLHRNPGILSPPAEGHRWICWAEDRVFPEPEGSGQRPALLPAERAEPGTQKYCSTHAHSVDFQIFPACRFDLYCRISVTGGSLRFAARCTFSKHSPQSPR